MPSRNYTLITGASEGLGKAFALECAARGMNLILVARHGKGLHNLANCIERNFLVIVNVFEKDLTMEADCLSLHKEISENKWSVNMLINNAGDGGSASFEEKELAYFQHMIKLNVMATTMITRLFINQLKQHNPAYILNVSSLATFFNISNKQVYGSTKSYIYHFSRSLKKELKPHNILVLVICPGGMNSNPRQYLQLSSGNWFVRNAMMSPESVAAIAIKYLIMGKAVLIPGKLNRISLIIQKLIPEKVYDIWVNSFMNLNSALTTSLKQIVDL
jgi:uncharacterized protein